MDFIKSRYISVFFAILVVLLAGTYFLNIYTSPKKPLIYGNSNSYYTIIDEDGNVLMETALEIHVDDEFIDEKNRHYIVTKVENKTAYAVIKNKPSAFNIDSLIPTTSLFVPKEVLNPKLNTRHVAIYHTHNDESYVLTSGKSAKPGNGDIVKVGEALKECLKKSSITVTHSLNNHGPHDINAYHRSRRTATELVKKGPDILIDIHRDGAPFKSYWTSINGIEVARVMIVIGRSNPNMQTNLAFAKKVKAAADEIHPGLMRGIFIGKGDYNQDLYPTAILVEVGTDSMSLSMAEKGAYCLGDALIKVLQESDS
ncbi:MAG: stage II sporulation protein P [Syntrophomonadaceae bacterium]|nr:stage II sporulation protein P [Syntrophomonadaceae bacterium]